MQPIHRRLRIIAFVYGLLYFLFIVVGTIPATRTAIFSHPELPIFRLEQAFAFLLFALFVVGMIIWSHSELGAGLVFLIWYAQVIWDELLSEHFGMGGGAGPVLGIPGLLIGVILVVLWAVHRLRSPPSVAPAQRG
ncbi:MAG: hypothetical protein WBS54_13825 [Acidobacteriota bacterium]